MTEIINFEINCKSSKALRGFDFAEMPPVIYGGKSEAKRRRLTRDGVNNHWNMTEIKDFERSVSLGCAEYEMLHVSVRLDKRRVLFPNLIG